MSSDLILDTILEIRDGFRSDGGRFALHVRGGRAECVRTDEVAEFEMDPTFSAASTCACIRRRSWLPPKLGFHF